MLRSFPLGEGDRLVSFLSRSEGRLKGVARGAQRLKSHFGSTLEPLSHVRIWFYERETRDLVRISQCELVESFYAAQSDYTKSIALALVSEIVETVLPEREATDAVFRLILVVSRALSQVNGIWLPLAYFALWSARLAGWLPSFESCQICGKPFGSEGAYSMTNGELVCHDCRLGGEPVSASMLKLGRRMMAKNLESFSEAPPSEKELKVLLKYLVGIIERETERKLSALELIAGEIEN